MTPAVTIVPCPADFYDWDRLLALIQRAFAPMDGVIDPPSSAKMLTASSLRQKSSEEIVFLAYRADHLVGCAFLAARRDHLYLGKLAVAPEHQGFGIGKRLLAEIERHACRIGIPAIELQTRVELTQNHATFARWSFREIGRTAHAGYNRPTSIIFRKTIA